jgi:hypothetical protein
MNRNVSFPFGTTIVALGGDIDVVVSCDNRKRIVLRLTKAFGRFLVRLDVTVSPSRPSSQREHCAERRSMIAKATATRRHRRH